MYHDVLGGYARMSLLRSEQPNKENQGVGDETTFSRHLAVDVTVAGRDLG